MRILSFLKRIVWRIDDILASESPMALAAEVD